MNELEELKNENERLKKLNENYKIVNEEHGMLNGMLMSRIEKAIEYIENNSLFVEEYDYNHEEELMLMGIEDSYAKDNLLKILKGDSNE